MKKIYLAIPYSGIEELSFKIANKISAKLMNEGNLVFSPISMCHVMAHEHSLPKTHHFWETLDKSFIDWCEELHIVSIHGHKEKNAAQFIVDSKGVCMERDYAIEKNKTILCQHFHISELL